MADLESKELSEYGPPERTRGAASGFFGDRLLWIALGLSVAACLAVYFYVPYINGPKAPKQWQWPYRHRDIFLQSCLAAAWRLSLGGALIGGVAWLLRRYMPTGTCRRWGGLLALFCWGIFFVWTSLIAATPMQLSHLTRIIKSQIWTSYFNVAQWTQSGRLPSLGETLQRYPELLPQFPIHASTHPPGAVLSSYALLRFFETHPDLSAATASLYQKIGAGAELGGLERYTSVEVAALSLAILVTLLGQLAVFPLFWLVRQAMSEASECGGEAQAERIAWVAAFIWIHYPALVLMTPAFDLVHPAITLICIHLTMKGMKSRPIVRGVALGLLFMAGITFTFTMLLLAPMLLLFAWLEMSRRAGSLRPKAVLQQASLKNRKGKSFWSLLAATIVTCVVVDLLLRFFLRIQLLQIFLAAVHHQNTKLLAELNRTFRVWVFYNIWDFLFFAGMALAVLALAWLVRSLRHWWRKPAAVIPAVAVFPLMILMVDLSHQLSAETARVWLFMAPGIAWAGAAELVRRSGDQWRGILMALWLMQTLFIYLCRTHMQLWGF